MALWGGEMLRSMKRSIWRRIDLLRYKYLTSKVAKPGFKHRELEAEGYRSQCGQDKWIIEKLFPGKKGGTFVDIGANDGITLSNTYLLETMGWNGIAVEPIPTVYEKLAKNRQCITVNGCIAPKTGKDHFRVITGYSEMLSGLVDEYDPKHLERIENELDSHGGDFNDIEVNCYNFNELLESNGISQVDYLNIDVEGVEYKILNSIDFDRIQVSIIGVENNYLDTTIPKLLMGKGFEFHSIVGDEFYRNKRAA